MRIYLASSFRFKNEIQEVFHKLTKFNHEIPDIWWNQDFKKEGPKGNLWYSHPFTLAIAERHFKNIRECDILVLVSHKLENHEHKFTGANIEVGYALALGIPVYSIGFLEKSAMYAHVIKCDSVDELIETLKIRNNSSR